MNAYVFVSTEVDEAKKVAQKRVRLTGVKLADCCWGKPDVIVFADVADAKALDGLVLGKIAKIAGVEATETHLVLAS